MDKIHELEERLQKLEMKTRASFLEVERMLSTIPRTVEIPDLINQRITEVEDLLLLLQVENAKIKEMVGGTAGFADTSVNDNDKRMDKLEEYIYSAKSASPVTNESAGNLSEVMGNLVKRIDYIDNLIKNINKDDLTKTNSIDFTNITNRISLIEKKLGSMPSIDNKEMENRFNKLEAMLNNSFEQIDDRINALEHGYLRNDKVIIAPEGSLLSEVQKILKGES